MKGLSEATLRAVAAELFGMELAIGDIADITARVQAWQRDLEASKALELSDVEPAFLNNRVPDRS